MLRTLPLLLAGLMVSGAALAQAPREPTEIHVSVQGVNFSNPTDVARLYQRLRVVADEACNSGISTLDARAEDRVCAAKALGDAVQAINQPALVALNGGEPTISVASNRL